MGGLYSTGSVTTLFRWPVPLFSSFFGFLNSKPMNILLLAIKLKSYLARLFKSHLARGFLALFWRLPVPFSIQQGPSSSGKFHCVRGSRSRLTDSLLQAIHQNHSLPAKR